jgi:S1-C subfamily serine protease
MAKNATLLRSAVVTLDSGRGTGSGFFIGREGYLLTNQHVVRDAKFLKVKLATGRELVGEVLQTNTRRDVALVKTESAGAEPLAIRATEPNIGEDVYAIGSPYGERFSGTLTRGVLSGHRTLDALRFLQSDVAVLPGNSGGPLLDADGRVVGIAVRALDAGRANLNLFIPIQEALDVLAVDIIP